MRLTERALLFNLQLLDHFSNYFQAEGKNERG